MQLLPYDSRVKADRASNGVDGLKATDFVRVAPQRCELTASFVFRNPSSHKQFASNAPNCNKLLKKQEKQRLVISPIDKEHIITTYHRGSLA